MTQPITTSRHRPGPGVMSDSIIDRIPPHDLAAEAATLASLIMSPACFDNVREFLPDAVMFFKEEHQIIYRTLLAMLAHSDQMDAVLLISRLRSDATLEQVGGEAYIRELCNGFVTAALAERYAALVKEAWVARNMLSAAHAIIRDVYDSPDTVDVKVRRAQEAMATASEVDRLTRGELVGTVLERVIDDLHKPADQQSEPFIPTGFPAIDGCLSGGLRNKQLITIAGHGKHGKSALAENIAANIAIRGNDPVAMISFEMSREELAERLLFAEAQLGRNTVTSDMTGEQLERYKAAMARIATAPLVLDDECEPTVAGVRARLMLYKRLHGINVGIVDYYQLMEGDRRWKRYDQLVEISRAMKNMAVELDMPIILIAQLNADAEKEDRLPRMNDIEECKKPSKDSNWVLLLDREWQRKCHDANWCDINMEKEFQARVNVVGRGGQRIVPLEFYGEYTRFFSVTEAA